MDVTALADGGLDGLGALVEAGRSVVVGLVPALAPVAPPSVEELAVRAAAVIDRLGFPRDVLRERIGVSPTCGLAGASGDWARTATTLTQRAAEVLALEPESISPTAAAERTEAAVECGYPAAGAGKPIAGMGLICLTSMIPWKHLIDEVESEVPGST